MINTHINTMMRIIKKKHKNNSTTDKHSDDSLFGDSSDFLRDAASIAAISAGFIVMELLYKHNFRIHEF